MFSDNNPDTTNKKAEEFSNRAINDAKKKADEGSNDSMRSATAGLQLPPGFKI